MDRAMANTALVLCTTASSYCGYQESRTQQHWRNETADELAKQATLLEFIGPEPVLGLSMMSIKRIIRQEIRSIGRVSAKCCCIIEIFDCNCNDLELGRFKVIQGQMSWFQSIAHGWFPIWLPLTQSSYLSLCSKYLTCNFNDLELGRFKIIKGQRSWCQSKAHSWFPIWPHWIQRRISHRIRDISCQNYVI